MPIQVYYNLVIKNGRETIVNKQRKIYKILQIFLLPCQVIQKLPLLIKGPVII